MARFASQISTKTQKKWKRTLKVKLPFWRQIDGPTDRHGLSSFWTHPTLKSIRVSNKHVFYKLISHRIRVRELYNRVPTVVVRSSKASDIPNNLKLIKFIIMSTRQVSLQSLSDNFTEKLNEIRFDGNPLWIDMRYSRLNASCLPTLLKWLSEHEEAKICVGYSNIGIFDICKSLMSRMGNLNWIINGRISIGATPEEQNFDRIRAKGFLEGREVSFLEASNKLSNFSEVMEKVSKAHEDNLKAHENIMKAHENIIKAQENIMKAQENNMKALDKLTHDLIMMENNTKRLLKSNTDVENWHEKIADHLEIFVTKFLRMHLILEKKTQDIEIVELPRHRRKIESLTKGFGRGFEWDGVLFFGDCLYLIEAKTSLLHSDIKKMASRIERTLNFINLCGSGNIQTNMDGIVVTAAAIKDRIKLIDYKATCDYWAMFKDVTTVYGVVGGISFTKQMFEEAGLEGLICVSPDDGMFRFDYPSNLTNFRNNSSEKIEEKSRFEIVANEELLDIIEISIDGDFDHYN